MTERKEKAAGYIIYTSMSKTATHACVLDHIDNLVTQVKRLDFLWLVKMER